MATALVPACSVQETPTNPSSDSQCNEAKPQNKSRRVNRPRGPPRAAVDLRPDTLMTTDELCAYLGIGRGTSRNWRVRAEGPPHRRVTARIIRYLKAEVDEWLAARKVRSTSESIRDE